MTSPVLPREVFDEIITQLTDDKTLKSCSLVCRSFCRSAQKILFDSIDIDFANTDNDDNGPRKLVLIVEHAPHLIEYIQMLQIFGNSICGPLDIVNTTGLANALGIFSRKGESFHINLRSLWLESLPWRFIPPGLQGALVLLMTVHSLRDIALHHGQDCPANLVQNLPPLLKHLSLAGTTFSSLPTTRKELPKLESLTIVFRDLSAGTGRGLDKFPGDAVESIILRPTSNSLEHLTLEQFNITDPDSVSIDLNRFSRLTDITINDRSHKDISLIPSLLILITKTMKKIPHRNVIRNLSFCLYLGLGINMVDFESAMKDVWQEVDAICFIPQLASSKSFRGITFIVGSSTASKCAAFSDLVQSKLPVTEKASKLHIETYIPFQ